MEAQIISILFGSFLLLLFIGAPITVALGVSTLISFIVLEDNPIKFVQIAFTSVGSFPLMALPAFILAGALMAWARGMSEFGAVMILAYNPKTIPVLIYERFAGFGLIAARPVAVVLIFVVLVIFVALRALFQPERAVVGAGD